MKDFQPRPGDQGYEVEWCSSLPSVPDHPDTADFDQATYKYRDFPTQDEADAFARRMIRHSASGSVRVTPFEQQDRTLRDYTGESEFYAS